MICGVPARTRPPDYPFGGRDLHVHAYVWIITILVMGALLFFDVLVLGRNPHIPSAKECATFVGSVRCV